MNLFLSLVFWGKKNTTCIVIIIIIILFGKFMFLGRGEDCLFFFPFGFGGGEDFLRRERKKEEEEEGEEERHGSTKKWAGKEKNLLLQTEAGGSNLLRDGKRK